MNLYNYFLNRLRDNLHIVLSFSPLHHKFPIRAQMFPAVFSGVNINWFLPWPGEALVAVSANFLKNFKIDTTEENRNRLYELMASFQNRIRDMSTTYLSRMRKHVYVTPRSFLCFIEYYKKLYATKYNEVNVQEKSVNIGLRKLEEAAKSVVDMQVEIERQEEVLQWETKKTNELLNKVREEKSKAEDKAEEVGTIAKDCEENASAIDADREEANRQLQEALPYLHEANSACQSIKDKDIVELKANKAPVDIVKMTFDGLLLLMGNKFLWLTGFLGLDLLAAVELDPELTNSIQALFDEAQPDHRIAEHQLDVPKLHTKLVDPFDEISVKNIKDMKEGSEADPFAELEALKPKPIPLAAKVPTPKVDAALPHTDATSAVAVSAQPPSKPMATHSADDQIHKQPEFILAKKLVAVNKSEQTLLKAVSFAKNDVVKVNDMGKATRVLSNKTQHAQNKTETVATMATKQVSRTVSTEPAKLAKVAEKEIKEVKEMKSGAFLRARDARAPTPAEAVANPIQVPETSKISKVPSSLAAFWTQEVPTAVKKAEDVVDVHPQLSQVALIQQQHRGVDFTKSPETSDSENSEPEISISEPFQALEQEDQRETQRLRDLDRHLRVKARRKVSEAASPAVKFLGTTGSIGSRFGASTASTWAKLEAEDQKVEDKILDLDDPRRPVDLRQYQQLNNMQDESMAELEGFVSRSSACLPQESSESASCIPLKLKVKPEDKIINKVSSTFIKDSYDEHAKSMLNDMNFLKNLKRFVSSSVVCRQRVFKKRDQTLEG
eukprot:symbB.v1.2.015262.t2/scaffold1130.1/size136251/9